MGGRTLASAARFLGAFAFWAVVLAVPTELFFRLTGLGSVTLLRVDEGGVLQVPEPGTTLVFRREGFSRFTYNAEGLRGPLVPDARAEGELRLAVLGDSYVEAAQVPDEATMVERLAEHLRAAALPGVRSVTALNYGQSGDTLALELLRYRHLVRKKRPQIVILVSTDGDLLDVLTYSEWPTSRWDGTDIVVDPAKLEWNDPRTARLHAWRKRLRDLFASYYLLIRFKGLLKDEAPAANADAVDKAAVPPGSAERYGAILARLKADVAADGATLVGVHVPKGYAVREDVPTVRDAYAQAYAAAGVPFVTAWDPLQAACRAEQWPYYGQPKRGGGHLNARGHALVAEVMARALRDGPWKEALP